MAQDLSFRISLQMEVMTKIERVLLFKKD